MMFSSRMFKGILLFVIFGFVFSENIETLQVGKFVLSVNEENICVLDALGKKELNVEIGTKLSTTDVKVNKIINGYELDWDAASLQIVTSEKAGQCIDVVWSSQQTSEFIDCVDFGTANWYGAFEQRNQLWPIEKIIVKNYTYVTKGFDNMGIAERLFLNSDGIYFYIEPYVPLFISLNGTGDNQLCFISRFEEPYKNVTDLRLHYQICTYENLKEAHDMSLINSLNAIKNELPDRRMIRDPIWSTWARYKGKINESVVLTFAQEIVDHGYNNSQIEIDDDWETCYGELIFNPDKFPNPSNMINILKSMGYRVTIWIHPFINEDCPSFINYKQAGYYVQDIYGNTTTSWWRGARAAIIDFTNTSTVNWFKQRLYSLQALGIDSFKFDAGESSWLPAQSVLNGDLSLQPNLYTSDYVNSLLEFIPLAEVRVGWQTQNKSIFVRMVDKDSNWSWNNGIKTLITTLFAMNTAGYSYVLPDMIGGNGYGLNISSELFVRWLQATTFMPALQFSYVPWDFNNPQIENICKTFVDLHAEYTDIIMDIANKSLSTGEPINRPLAYLINPTIDQLNIDDQFMLGDIILVAPVLNEGDISRDVYLPIGNWTDMNTGQILQGGVWLRNYSAPLDILPYFKLNEM